MTEVTNKAAVLRKLEAIESAIATERRSPVAVARQDLASLVNLSAQDRVSVMLNKVFLLTGKWTRGAVDVDPAEIKIALDEAIALLQS
jgi:hypothetical protein